jgi:tRNA pseudouridine13 synthase
MHLPYLTAGLPGSGGIIKQRSEDFFVQEIPAYQPSGEGEHIYCEIQKANLTTFDAIDRIARALRIPGMDIGYAGMKDARAVSRQIFSIRGTTEQAVMGLAIPDLQVLWAARHGNKMRLGHLRGNRFAIRIRDVQATDVIRIQPVIEVLKARGMPNYFGEQRFGRRGDNHLLGGAFVAGDDAGVLSLLLGSPNPAVDDSNTLGARKAFDRGDLELSMKLWPRRSGMERRILHRLIKTGKPAAAVKAVDEKLRRLWVSALQSALFNQVLARRIDTIDTILEGDLAYKHENGACFTVEDAAAEQPRAAAFEISPTGPMVGYRISLPQGRPLEIEQQVLAEHQLAPEHFRVEGRLRMKGGRRPLRVRPEDVDLAGGVDQFGQHITVAFTLPAGSFATIFLREVMKSDPPEAADMPEAPEAL